MLQIIGWLGCAMLAVKLLEMAANPALRLESGTPKDSVLLAMLIGWASVFGFALWLYVQGQPVSDLPPRPSDLPNLSDDQISCISRARNNDEVLACVR